MEIAPAQDPTTGPEFNELVRKIRDRDRGAEEELVARYQRAVAIIIRRRTIDSFAVEDLCQETFRLALEKIRAGELREAVKLSGFICGVARNLASDHFREGRRRGARNDAAESPSLSDPSPSQLERLLLREKAAAVRRVLGELKSARDREMLVRFCVNEEDKDQICLDLGLSSLHFNRVLHRARERFKELYEKMGEK